MQLKKTCKNLQDLIEEGKEEAVMPFIEDLMRKDHVEAPISRTTDVLVVNPLYDMEFNMDIDLEHARKQYEHVNEWLNFIWNHRTEIQREIALAKQN